MLRRGKMHDPLDVGRPENGIRVLRPGYNKPAGAGQAGRLDQELVQRRLAVRTVRSQVSQVPSFGPALRVIESGIDRTVQRPGAGRPEFTLNPVEHGTTREGEVQL